MKYYQTNKFKSVLFYVAILLPFLIILITFVMLPHIKEYWSALLFFYIFVLPMEYVAIKYWKVNIIINEEGIEIKSSKRILKTEWANIIELKELLFGQGEFFYELKTKDKKKIGFTSSIENCGDLLREIENRTGLKFKQRL